MLAIMPNRRKGGIGAIMIAAAAAASTPAVADLAVKNNAGGAIVLSELPCVVEKVSGDNLAYHYNENGVGEYGCWKKSGTKAVVQWSTDGTVMEYDLNIFSPLPAPAGKNMLSI